MDKIKEEFEKKIKHWTDSNLKIFTAGYKSRDEEIKKLVLHDKITKDYTTELIIKNGRQEAEIKKLRDALEWIVEIIRTNFNELYEGSENHINSIAEEALKESE